MSNKWKWTLIVALFFSAAIALTFVGAPSDRLVHPQASTVATGEPARDRFDSQPGGPAKQPAGTRERRESPSIVARDGTQRMYRPEVAPHHLVNPVVRLECENPDDSFDCRLVIENDHPYYDSARFDSQTLETLAANYDPVAALVLAQRFSFEPDERTRRFLEAATYSGRAGPLIVMVRDFENDPTDLASAINRCKYLYVATWMDYPLDEDGGLLSRSCDKVAALGGNRKLARKDAQALFSRINERRRATVGATANGGAS